MMHRRVPAVRAIAFGVVLATVLLAAAAEAMAATLHVDQSHANCSNTGPGTQTQPFCAISAAASRTAPGDTVLVKGGTYSERVNVRSGMAGSPVTLKAAEGETVTVRGGQYGFYASARSWVDIEGFNVEDTVSDAFHISSGSSNIKLIGNRASRAGEPVVNQTAKGIAVSNSSDIRIEGNTTVSNSNYGIYVTSSARVAVVGNESALNAKVFERAAPGIRVYNSDSNTVVSNVSHHNEDSGIELVSGSDGNLVANNVTYDNGDHGIDVTGNSRSARVVSNSVYNSVTAGINVEGGSTDATVVNNVSVDNAINSPRTRGNIRVDSASISVGTVVDYNLVNLRASGHNYNWSGLGYATLAQFRAASGHEAHGIQADPRWVSPSSGDFRLGPGSPAIDSANSGASGQPSTDVAGNPRLDDPATPNSGAGPRAFDDRGAFEYQLSHGPPTAALAVTPSSGLVDLAVTADASASTDSDGLSPIESYSFDFGDGSAPIGPQPGATAAHTYTSSGTYTVTVTVRDTAGFTDTSTNQVTVTDDPPRAALDVTPSSGGAPLLVTADASGSTDTDGEPIESYSFDFGDGSAPVGPQPGATATHTYTAGGTYTVTVTVRDEGGLTSVATRQVTVAMGEDHPPTAALNVTPDSGLIDLDVTADASGSTDNDPTSPIESYRFDFGDGSPVVGPQPGATATHTYTSPGTYTVTVTVKDTLGLASTQTKQVTVRDDPPNAALTVTPDSGLAPLEVAADASGSTDADATPIESYAFDFGDGSPLVGPQPGATATHTYTAPGTYTVTVTVRDTAGNPATATRQVVATANLVRNPGFETDLSGWNTSGSGAGIALTRVSPGHSGSFAAKLANTGTGASTCTLNDSPDWARPTSAGTYTGSVWARADTAGAALRLRFREWSGSTLVGTAFSQLTLTTSWQRVSVDYTTGSPGSTLDLNAYVTGAAPGTCFYVDDATVVLH